MKTPWIVIALCCFLILAGILRLFGKDIPSLTVASFSIVALLVSLADIFEAFRFKMLHQRNVLIAAMIFFILALIFWVLLPLELDKEIIQNLGDGFTILGIAAVIMIFGIKELKSSPVLASISDKEIEFLMTKHEYDEMMSLNDIIEQLKLVDNDSFPYNRVHDGWALFHDSIAEHWNKWKGPFFDSLNREMYFDFIKKLSIATENFGNIADTDPRMFREKNIKMWNEEVTVTIQPAYRDPSLPDIKQSQSQLVTTLHDWDTLKSQITKRFEQSRARQ
ncbi:APC family permease [Paenibacillus xylanexedens]|uniref:APC family permease n=1 Tax=Paenibacillus xylanexedens TaxID=528191 RepID=UPI00119CFAC4|nr:APC family permease [Paenibacillus xylanexedens]